MENIDNEYYLEGAIILEKNNIENTINEIKLYNDLCIGVKEIVVFWVILIIICLIIEKSIVLLKNIKLKK